MVTANAGRMEVVANGKPRAMEPGWTVEDLIKSLGLDPRFVIVEHNGEAMERKRYAEVSLSMGDRIELVRAVAGG
ncbi:MAG: sulfur carrier protein ThiS [Actinomycetota bacterium]